MITLATFNPTGIKHSSFSKVVDDITVGTFLSLIRRPDNSYDSEAISLHFGSGVTDPMVGWVPANSDFAKGRKSVINALISGGLDVRCLVTEVSKPEYLLEVTIYIDNDSLEEEDPDND